MADHLFVIAEGEIMGQIDCGPNIDLTFTYTDEWRNKGEKFPLSLSMPVAAKRHKSEAVTAFLWGLLPDSDYVLSQWAKKFQVSARNPFKLISHVGEDCAGAVQFVLPDRVEAVLAGEGDFTPISESEIAARLRQLKRDNAATRTPRDTGQFSLAGAQPKTAFTRIDGQWGVGSGSVPTTHIFKPPTGEFDGFAENEHFCLELARRMGMITAASDVLQFEDQQAIVVKRYDRRADRNPIIRTHQEDFCQAMAVLPHDKYQKDGGPGIKDSLDLLKRSSFSQDADKQRFMEAIAFNWFIGGTDAHAKNYSMLISGNGQARLAPLYDISSALPYPEIDAKRIKLAMKIGNTYRLRDITPSQWEKLWAEIKYDVEHGRTWFKAWSEKLPDMISETRARIEAKGLNHPILERLESTLIQRANSVLGELY